MWLDLLLEIVGTAIISITSMALGFWVLRHYFREKEKREKAKREEPDTQRRDRFTRGRCQRCGCDLTGNVSGACPECGASL